MENDTVVGYVLLSPEGIPIRHHDRMPYNEAVMYASLITDFALRARSVLNQLASGTVSSDQLRNFRFRTMAGTEIITTVCSEYLLVVIQNCTGKPWKWSEDNSNEAVLS